MKPGKKDIRYKILITGLQLEELHKYTVDMLEAFGLDRKIENYKGTRPITLYSWDLDCLEDVIFLALRDPKEYPDKQSDEHKAMHELYVRIKNLRLE